MVKDSGIYAFFYKSEYCYVGQSCSISTRLATHKRDILLKRHSNLSDFLDYEISDFEFKTLELCDGDFLNDREIFYEKELSITHTLLNKKTCGMQQSPNFNKKIISGIDYKVTYRNGIFNVGETVIGKVGKLHCLSDFSRFIKLNSNFDLRYNEIINRVEFKDRISALKNICLSSDIILDLKVKKLYKTIGKGLKRKTYCDYDVFLTILYYSCPQISASLIICLIENGWVKTEFDILKAIEQYN